MRCLSEASRSPCSHFCLRDSVISDFSLVWRVIAAADPEGGMTRLGVGSVEVEEVFGAASPCVTMESDVAGGGAREKSAMGMCE